MNKFILIAFILVGSAFTQAQSLMGLESVMKDQVGAPFKIVFSHIVKMGQIDPAGTTLKAAEDARAGLVIAIDKAPAHLLNSQGALKDASSGAQFKGYQMGVKMMIDEMTKLVQILRTDMPEADKIAEAKKQVSAIVRMQKKAHDEFKEEE